MHIASPALGIILFPLVFGIDEVKRNDCDAHDDYPQQNPKETEGQAEHQWLGAVRQAVNGENDWKKCQYRYDDE
ncbi:hypothetical protein GCM10027562_33090 [Arthrobacter pigmenti]